MTEATGFPGQGDPVASRLAEALDAPAIPGGSRMPAAKPAPDDSGQASPAGPDGSRECSGAVPSEADDSVAQLRRIADQDIGGNAPWLADKLHAFADQLAAEMRGECQLEVCQRAEAAEARLLELENAITWNTSCTSCAGVLDLAAAQTFAREAADAKLTAIAGECRDTIRSPECPEGEMLLALAILAITGTEEETGNG